MSLKIYNTLSGQKEEFKPLRPGEVGMYVCGPTVYNAIHVGNARPMVFFDVVFRYLKAKGFNMTYVRNITDIDDKIIKKAEEEKISLQSVSHKYEALFFEDMEKLGLLKPTHSPRATEHVEEMISWIGDLLDRKIAYNVNGEILFSIDQFKSYGKLSKKKVEDLLAGARVEVSQNKKNPLDFVLWKPSKKGEPAWKAPWGEGRPGWHIECSVMSTKFLGESFDIHGAGKDLIFPHHENEIAQSESVTQKPFVKIWMHNGMLIFGKEKMSKSLGNIVTAHDFLKNYPGELLKFILLSNHYRSDLDFSDQSIEEGLANLEKIYETLLAIKDMLVRKATSTGKSRATIQKELSQFKERFIEALDDDFNTAKVFGVVFDAIRSINRELSKGIITQELQSLFKQFMKDLGEMSELLGLFGEPPQEFLEVIQQTLPKNFLLTKQEINDHVKKRSKARDAKDWKEADRLRDFLLEKNILLKDTPKGTVWKVKRS